jgi:hypothetical protein
MIESVQTEVLDPFTHCLTPEVGRRIADLRADAEMPRCVDELAGKANKGRLSERERAEYDTYRSAFHFVTILQAKAGSLVKQASE